MTDLTDVVVDTKTCIICLDTHPSVESMNGYYLCNCRDCTFHRDCWTNYLTSEQSARCPICRKEYESFIPAVRVDDVPFLFRSALWWTPARRDDQERCPFQLQITSLLVYICTLIALMEDSSNKRLQTFAIFHVFYLCDFVLLSRIPGWTYVHPSFRCYFFMHHIISCSSFVLCIQYELNYWILASHTLMGLYHLMFFATRCPRAT